MEIIIRDYKTEDFDRLVELCNEFQDYLVDIDPDHRLRRTPEYGKYSVERKLKNLDARRAALYVAEDGKNVIGFIFGAVDPSAPEQAGYSITPAITGTIEELAVTQEYRGKRIGHALMERMEEFFKNQNCNDIHVSVLAFNGGAHRLYKNIGYRDRGIFMTKRVDSLERSIKEHEGQDLYNPSNKSQQ